MKLSKKSVKKLSLSFLLLFLANNSQLLAAGYQTGLYSTSGLGNAYAGGATGIHDASDMFFNPAISANLEKSQFIASVSYLKLNINAHDVHSKDPYGNEVKGTEKDAGVDSAVPAFYLATPINKETTFGLSINSPLGLATKYNKNWSGKYYGLESSIATININPSLSYKLNNQLAIGVGVSAQYLKTKLTNAVYTGSSDAFGKSEGSDWGYGYNLGATYKANDQLKFGLGYRSKIDYKITGKTDLSVFDLNSKFNSKTTTPESLTLGTSYQLNKTVELAYDISWTRWSRLKNLTINNYQNSALNVGNQTNFNWHDSFLNSVGANFVLNNKWLLRTGLAYEKDASSDSYREVRIPTSDRTWATIGFNYKIRDNFSVDAAYAHQFYKSTIVNLSSSTSGIIEAKYRTVVDVLSIGLKAEF